MSKFYFIFSNRINVRKLARISEALMIALEQLVNCPSRAFAPSYDVLSIAYQLLQQGNFRLRLEAQHSFLPALSHVWRWRMKTTILLPSVRSVETEQRSRPFSWKRWSVFFRRRTILMFTRGSSWHCVAT